MNTTRTRVAGIAAGTAAAAGATAAAAKVLRDRRGFGSSRYRLARDESVDFGLRRVAAGRADSALAHLRGEGAENHAEAIHETRKDLKKLRSVLRLAREPLGEDVYQRENTRFRDAGRLLSGARDSEVKLETLGKLHERFGSPLPEGEPSELTKALEGERRATSARTSRVDDRSPRAAAIGHIEAGREAISELPLDGDGFELIAAGLRRSYSRGRKRFAATRGDPSGENVHEWRKRVKDLWYHLRLVRDARKGKLGKAADRADELSDLLGDHHDLELLREDAAGRPGVVAAADRAELDRLIERREDELLDRATSVAKRLYAEKPKRFIARIEGYWTEWR